MHAIQLHEDDPDYEPLSTPERCAAEQELEVAMDEDEDLSQTQPSQELANLASPGTPVSPAAATSPPAAAAASPPAAAGSSSAVPHTYGTRQAGAGAPAWKAQAGKEAQEAARSSERLRHGHKVAEAGELLAQAAEGSAVNSPYAAKQAKAVATQLFSAGSLSSAKKVITKFAALPEIRALVEFAENPNRELDERLIQNVIKFFEDHLRTRGNRHAEDQNIHDAILAALVDRDMESEKLINTVATCLGVRWDTVKRAVLRRMKLDDEETEKVEGAWTRRKRSTRCDRYELPGLYAFCHDETIFRFSSRRSEPLREHVDVREYKVCRTYSSHSRM